MKRHGKLPKKLQDIYDKIVEPTIVPNANEYLIGLHHIKETEFNNTMLDLLEKVKNIMLSKANQYNENPSDRFDQFKKASTLTKISPVRTLYGMWVKHIISLSDMISSEKQYPKELWEEKIIDNINYLLLLAGAIKEFDLIEKK